MSNTTPGAGRVCYITQWYPPEPVGVSHWIPEQLARLGWDVRVLTGVPNWPSGEVHKGYRASRASRELVNGLEVRRAPLYPSHDASAARRMLNYLSWALSSTAYGLRDLRTADVAVVHSSPATAALPAMVARLLFRRRYVLMIQDLWPDSVFSSGFLTTGLVSKLAHATLGWFTKASYRMASHITVLSPSMKGLLVDRGVPADKISLVYNWVDEDELCAAEPDAELRTSLGLTDDDFIAMYAGAHGPAQGLGTLIDAIAQLPTDERIHLVSVGDGIEHDALREQAERLGVTDRVHFLGRRPMADMPGLFAAADLQIASLIDTPLFRVNMPSKIATIMHSGQPLLVVAIGDPADAVTSVDAGFSARPGDPASVAEALLTARRAGADTLAAMGANGRNAYNTTMSAAIGGERLSTILARVARPQTKEKKS